MWFPRGILILVTCLMCPEGRARQETLSDATGVEDTTAQALATLVLALSSSRALQQVATSAHLNPGAPAIAHRRPVMNIAEKAVHRREMLSHVAAAAAAIGSTPMAAHAVAARTGLSSVFQGEYEDSNHPGCLRSIKVVGGKRGPSGNYSPFPTAIVKGVDGLPAGSKECPAGVKPALADLWNLEGKIVDNEDEQIVKIDFSPKGGPASVVGKYDVADGKPGILFPDGNKWIKINEGTPERRPDLKTLSTEE